MSDADLDQEFTHARQEHARRIQAENDSLQDQVRAKDKELARYQKQLAANEKRLKICKEKYGPKCGIRYSPPEDWRVKLRRSESLREVYKAAGKQHNMSSVRQNHGLYYVAPGEGDLGDYEEVVDPRAGFKSGMTFDFLRLVTHHSDIALRIVTYAMVKDTAISVVARFDVHDTYPPTQGGVDSKTGLSYRFHWGGFACAINSSPLPEDVLAPILVSKIWYNIFATAFYALNIFSFSSLGEFIIFCRKTPLAMRQRIRAMRLMWIGSRMATSNPKKSGPRWCRSRADLHILSEFVNLEYLEINLDETAKNRIRRKHEPKKIKKPLLKSTRGHDNYTNNRSLTTMRGMDSLCQIRGLKRLEVYDYNAETPMANVRDQTFVKNMRQQTYSTKTEKDIKNAKLQNLRPLLPKKKDSPRLVLPRKVQRLVKKLFNTRMSFLVPDGVEDVGGTAPDDESDSDSDSDPDLDSDSDSDTDAEDNRDNDWDGRSDSLDNQDLDARDNDGDDGTNSLDNQNPDDSSDEGSSGSEDDDDTPDQEAHGPRAARVVTENKSYVGSIQNESYSDSKDCKVIGPNYFEIKDEEDEVQFVKEVKRKRPFTTVDLTKDSDILQPIEEGDQVKHEVKDEEENGQICSMASIPAFNGESSHQSHMKEETPYHGVSSPLNREKLRSYYRDQPSLFVTQSVSPGCYTSDDDTGYPRRHCSSSKRSFYGYCASSIGYLPQSLSPFAGVRSPKRQRTSSAIEETKNEE